MIQKSPKTASKDVLLHAKAINIRQIYRTDRRTNCYILLQTFLGDSR